MFFALRTEENVLPPHPLKGVFSTKGIGEWANKLDSTLDQEGVQSEL